MIDKIKEANETASCPDAGDIHGTNLTFQVNRDPHHEPGWRASHDLGNHDFNYGQEELDYHEATSPLAANIVREDDGENPTNPTSV